MNTIRRSATFFLWCALACLLKSLPAFPQTVPAPSESKAQPVRDGQHDFDFEFGTWKIHLKRLLHPLTGSTTWVEFDGTSVTRKVWEGRAEIEEFETNGAAGHIEGLTLRLYNPQSHQWSLYWANSKNGTLGQPTIGEFKNGRGEFFDQETFNGRSILVRFIWSEMTPTSAHFEQSFSGDGGKTWEVNWITDQTRTQGESDQAHSFPEISQTFPEVSEARPQHGSTERDGQHDFDLEFGQWTTHIRRLLHPLTSSDAWVDLAGTSIVRKIWDGHANLGELEVDGSASHIEGLSLRVYNPQTHQWSIYWSNSKDGSLGTPMIGQFKNGRGEFYDQELFQGAAIYVRFIFSGMTATTFQLEQAFSADGGKTWEPNWIATFNRATPAS